MGKLLMCHPSQFDVTYDINHWMHDQAGHVNKHRAIQQWYNLYNALNAELPIEVLNGSEGLPDLVFTANAGLIRKDIAILSRFATKERRPEEKVFRKWFEEKGYSVFQPTYDYEGEGDHLRDSFGREWMGYGFRSDNNAAFEIASVIEKDINVLRLIDSRWYHLDTAFCPLPNGAVMYYPGAFSPSSQKLITESFETRIEVSLEDALRFCCNCVCIDDKLFMPKAPGVVDALTNLGFTVWQTDLSEFLKAGGAAKCLVLHFD